jgi:hypothetical protein
VKPILSIYSMPYLYDENKKYEFFDQKFDFPGSYTAAFDKTVYLA